VLIRSMSVGRIWLLPFCILLHEILEMASQEPGSIAETSMLSCHWASACLVGTWMGCAGALAMSTPELRGDVHHLELPRGLQ
jgi:hypothetical protein